MYNIVMVLITAYRLLWRVIAQPLPHFSDELVPKANTAGGLSRGIGTNWYPCDFISRSVLGNAKVMGALQVEPKLRASPEPAGEAKRSVAGDAAASANDFRYAVGRDIDLPCERGWRNAEFAQFVGKDFAGMDGRAHVGAHGRTNVRRAHVRRTNVSRPHWCTHNSNSLVVVYNFNIRRASVAFGPLEADTPLFVDPNAALPRRVVLQDFKMVAGQRAQISKFVAAFKIMRRLFACWAKP